MSVLIIIQYIVDILTVATGVFTLVAPRKIKGFTGLFPDNPRGVTEIRAVMGGVFIALGIVALFFHAPSTNTMLGVMYLVIGLVRTISMFADKSLVSSNFISLAVEVVFGLVMLF
jgi:uncharacterized membrane protein HdeD (DUF308 family)